MQCFVFFWYGYMKMISILECVCVDNMVTTGENKKHLQQTI